MDIDVQIRDYRLETSLHIGHRLVVNDRADFLQEESKEPGGSDVADFLLHVLLEVTFDGRDGLLACVVGNFDGHGRADGDDDG